MPPAVNWIGSRAFLTLDGVPRGIGDSGVVLSRPGVDGSAVWLTGERGKPFTLRSSIDAFDLAYAMQLYAAYRQMVGELVDLIWNGLEMTNSTTQIIVVDVTPVDGRVFAMTGGVGGLSPPSKGWIECDWKLVAVTVPAPE